MSVVELEITGEDQFTDSIAPLVGLVNKFKINCYGRLNVSISGDSWSGTVTLQRSFDGGSSWLDVDTFAANYEGYLTDFESGVVYRIGVKTGNFSSGPIYVRLSK